jgi:hypothetical protein
MLCQVWPWACGSGAAEGGSIWTDGTVPGSSEECQVGCQSWVLPDMLSAAVVPSPQGWTDSDGWHHHWCKVRYGGKCLNTLISLLDDGELADSLLWLCRTKCTEVNMTISSMCETVQHKQKLYVKSLRFGHVTWWFEQWLHWRLYIYPPSIRNPVCFDPASSGV